MFSQNNIHPGHKKTHRPVLRKYFPWRFMTSFPGLQNILKRGNNTSMEGFCSERDMKTTSSSSEEDKLKHLKYCSTGVGNGAAARHVVNGRNYQLVFKDTGSVVQVLDKTVRNAKGRAQPVVRLDSPHPWFDFNHININPKISKLKKPRLSDSGKIKMKPYDPHLKVGGGSTALSVSKNTIRTMKYANWALIAVSVTADVVRTGCNISADVKAKTTRNTLECVSNIAGGWGGGAAGAAGGAAIGSAIFPGVGTIIGGIVGGITGGIGGSEITTVVAEAVGDAVDYDIDTWYCRPCTRRFKVRRYKGQRTDCPRCGGEDTCQTVLHGDDFWTIPERTMRPDNMSDNISEKR